MNYEKWPSKLTSQQELNSLLKAAFITSKRLSKKSLPPACDFQISLTINCESTWLGLVNTNHLAK